MSEAFEVGVTLALSDGVSESIASTKRDMASLEQVLQAGGVSVQQLRAAAAEIVSVTRQPVIARQPVAEAGRVSSDDSSAVDVARWPGSPAQQAGEERPPEREQLRDAADTEVGHTSLVRSEQPQLSPRRPTAPDFAERPVRLSVKSDDRPDSPQQASPAVDEGGSLPVTIMLPTAQAPSSTVWSPGGVASTDESAVQQRGDVRNEAAPVMGYGHDRSWTQQRQDALNLVPDYSGFLDQSQVPRPFSAVPSRELSQASPVSAVARAVAPTNQPYVPPGHTGAEEDENNSREQAPAAPTAHASSSSPSEGDVFLDGALVGRWMSKHLTQQVGRASAGPTGFDPRRGRLLPGATVGN